MKVHSDVVKLRLDNDTLIDIRCDDGATPLFIVVKQLLDKSADVNSVKNETESCLLRAATNGYINVVSIHLCLLELT